MCVAIFQRLQIDNLLTEFQFFINTKMYCCQWSRLFAFSYYLHWFRPNILWTLGSCYWQRGFSALQVWCRYDWFTTNEVEDPVSLISNTLRLWFPFTTLMRTAWSTFCVMFIANFVVASEAPVVVSFFEKLLCKGWLCRRPQLHSLQFLLLQSFDRWQGLRQLKPSLNFCTFSCRLFSFIGLNF